MRWLLATVFAAASGPAALACINDREVQTHEREFKSQYDTDAPPTRSASPDSPDAVPTAAISGGAALLLAAGFVTLRRPRPRG
jgi:hypothetical protein